MEDPSTSTFNEASQVTGTQTMLGEWAATLSLPNMLASSISTKINTDRLYDLRCLTPEDLDEIIRHFGNNVKSSLQSTIAALTLAPRRSELNENGSLQARIGGSVSHFHKPLTDSLGWPLLDFYEGMEVEHELGLPFQDGQHPDVQILPKHEFQLVIKRVSPENISHSRIIQDINTLWRAEVSKSAKLRREEVIVVVLYTGPMFSAYNTELRSKFHGDLASTSTQAEDSQYVTTIFVIASAIVKLTRVQSIPCGLLLYRGLGADAIFPDFFYRADGVGCKGITEPAFMSTTSKWATAVRYSGVANMDSPFPTVLEIHARSVDRGANIKEFSQYHHEGEFHWTPGCFLEPTGIWEEVTEHGMLKVFQVRVNCNQKNLTIDELLSMRKSLHLQAFELLINDVRHTS